MVRQLKSVSNIKWIHKPGYVCVYHVFLVKLSAQIKHLLRILQANLDYKYNYTRIVLLH